MNNQVITIPLDDKIQEFRQHLNDNERIIFSAKFGDGKTTFLNEFQKNEEQKDCYFMTLHPVNYSVATNEDVFEYIKRDILFQLNKENKLNGIDLDAIFDGMLTWAFWQPVVSYLLTFIPGGEFYDKLINKCKSFIDAYQDKKNNFEKYESTFISQRGGLYEDDGYTRMIKAAVEWIQKVEGKKVILIIEDMDRIDPAHMFRILNILGAHIDVEETHNKFHVDNIIVVLDYEVTKSVFAHFYGDKANYDGYMSKFYSHYRYEYSIHQVAREELQKFLIRIGMPEQFTSVSLYDDHNMIRHTIGMAISTLSVRRVVQILSNFESQIQRKEFNVRGRGMTILDAPILYLLAAIVRLNGTFYKHIIIESMQQCDMLLPMLGSFLLCDTAVASGAPFKYNSKTYVAEIEHDAVNNISRVKIIPVTSQGPIDLNYSTIDRAFNLACNSVKDCIIY